VNLKTGLVVAGFIMIAVALADLLTGNTQHQLLPDAVGNNLDQQHDVGLLVVGGGLVFYGLNYAK
jgi:hypothetical protein